MSMRIAAVNALAQISEKGNADAIDAVVKRLEAMDGSAGFGTLEALAQIADTGNTRAIRRRHPPLVHQSKL